MDTEVRADRHKDEIRLRELVEVIAEHRIVVAAFVLTCTLAVAAAAYLLPRKYDSTIVISPVTNTSEKAFGGAGGALGSLSGLAALAGVSLGADSKKTESIAILQSDALSERYIHDNNLLPILYSDIWDRAHGKWRVSDPQKTPTLWKAKEFFKHGVRTVSTDAKTGMVSVTVRWTDPVLAAQWANGLVKLANDYERETALAESQRNIAYLTQQAATTDVVGIKQAIYTLLQSEISKAMLAKGTTEYAFKVIDPATVPERPSYPQRIIWILTAFFASFVLAIFAAFMRVAWRKS
jgi:uncharacterized protein involved in exopolysaccharide biosynthesis